MDLLREQDIQIPNLEEVIRFTASAHAGQVRKYTGEAYIVHPAEVAGWTASAFVNDPLPQVPAALAIAVAWGHDLIEDTMKHLTVKQREALLTAKFGPHFAYGVMSLSDLEEGNRAARKAAGVGRLASLPGWLQTIKCADSISNTRSIRHHDPKFWPTYRDEKLALIPRLTKADPFLHALALSLLE